MVFGRLEALVGGLQIGLEFSDRDFSLLGLVLADDLGLRAGDATQLLLDLQTLAIVDNVLCS